MGLFSGFSTKSAALTMGVVFLVALPMNAVSGQSGATTAATIDIAVSGLRSTKGNVLVCLSANPKFFPDCRKDNQARKITIDATDAAQISIADVKPGTYALALIHDENANGKMDLALFLPREGFGFSRNPKIGVGPPKFKSAQFDIGGDSASFDIKMKYLF